MRSRQQGFTLVELAIALMVIGLLIGGVLKGQELIENARMTAFIRQIKAYDAATMIFRNTYGALPGDIKRPNRIPNCTEEMCNMGGNGNGKIYSSDSTSPSGLENYNFFPHLTKAGMIQGPQGGTQADMSGDRDIFFPASPFATYYEFAISWTDGTFTYLSQPGHYYEFFGLNCVQAMQLDTKMDDGKPRSGSVISASSDCTNEDGSVTEIEYITEGSYSEMEVHTAF